MQWHYRCPARPADLGCRTGKRSSLGCPFCFPDSGNSASQTVSLRCNTLKSNTAICSLAGNQHDYYQGTGANAAVVQVFDITAWQSSPAVSRASIAAQADHAVNVNSFSNASSNNCSPSCCNCSPTAAMSIPNESSCANTSFAPSTSSNKRPAASP